jgi:hypothetical protein
MRVLQDAFLRSVDWWPALLAIWLPTGVFSLIVTAILMKTRMERLWRWTSLFVPPLSWLLVLAFIAWEPPHRGNMDILLGFVEFYYTFVAALFLPGAVFLAALGGAKKRKMGITKAIISLFFGLLFVFLSLVAHMIAIYLL